MSFSFQFAGQNPLRGEIEAAENEIQDIEKNAPQEKREEKRKETKHVETRTKFFGLTAEQIQGLTVLHSLNNFIPVTIGNILGGMVFVGIPCYFIYKKKWQKWHEACQTGATMEGITADACHTVGNCNTRKFRATIECLNADTRHAIGDSYACKSRATLECQIADTRHTVGDCYARKFRATLEGTLADARHAVTDCHARQVAATFEGTIANACHAVGNCDCTLNCPRHINNLSFIFIIKYSVNT